MQFRGGHRATLKIAATILLESLTLSVYERMVAPRQSGAQGRRQSRHVQTTRSAWP